MTNQHEATDSTLPLAVLDFVGIEYGEPAHAAIAGAVDVAQAVEDAGYRRYWVSEHHNMRSLACSAPEILIAHLGAKTSRIRVGAAGIMLPNHAPFKVAETFRTLLAMYPGRIDLGLGRAPGTDPLTAHVLRRGIGGDAGSEFPGQVAELLAFLGDGSEFPEDHPYRRLVAAPVVDEQPEIFMLGSSPYGPGFAAVNGMRAVFAHHQSPELAFEVLRDYRDRFRKQWTAWFPGRAYHRDLAEALRSVCPDGVDLTAQRPTTWRPCRDQPGGQHHRDEIAAAKRDAIGAWRIHETFDWVRTRDPAAMLSASGRSK